MKGETVVPSEASQETKLLAGEATVFLSMPNSPVLGGEQVKFKVDWSADIKPTKLEQVCRLLGQSIYSYYKMALGLPPYHGMTIEQRRRKMGLGE